MKLNDEFGIYEKSVKLRARRSEVLANNLANADTPGFKARDLDFRHILQEQAGRQTALKATNKAHFRTSSPNATAMGNLQYRIPHQPSVDGNTVEPELEQARFSENAMRYQASLRFLDGRIQTLKTAIKGQ